MPVTSWSTTAADNNAAPPNGWPEGMAPSAVNNTARQMMADLVREFQVNAVKVLASVAGTNTITGTMTPDLTSYGTGMLVFFTPANNCTGATTINIDSLGAKSIVRGDGTALESGDLQASTTHAILYDGTNFVLLNPISFSLVNGTLSGNLAVTGTSAFTGTTTYGGNEVGYRQLIQRTFSGNDSEAAADAGRAVEYTGAGGHTFTLDGEINASGGIITIFNNGSGNLTIATTGTISWYNGSGTISTGSRTLAVGGVASAWRQAANYRVWGTGLS
jgi:hypothetical protein